MNIEQIREYCLKKKGVTEEFPFDEETLVFKVMGKIFILASLDSIPLQVNLKCDPEKAIELREEYEAVQPGYHMNKRHWNTVIIDGSIPNKKILGWIDYSYNLVAAGLKKADREKLNKLTNK
jgi:predicted DNA-binding protein (MmcQ/YjbR family)